ncbi:hypothetical protein ENKOMM052M1_21835 [Enterobacter kobei]
MNNVVCFLYVNPKTNRDGGENDHAKAGLGLEIINQSLAVILTMTFSAGVAVDDHWTETKSLLNSVLYLALKIAQLSKDDYFVFAGVLNFIQCFQHPIKLG